MTTFGLGAGFYQKSGAPDKYRVHRSNAAQTQHVNGSVDEARPYLVELLHPIGVVHDWRVLGTNWAGDCPNPSSKCGNAQVDLVILALSRSECRRKRLKELVMSTVNSVDPTGIIWIQASPSIRFRIRRLLKTRGFFFEDPMIQLPLGQPMRLLLPLDRGPIHYGLPGIGWRSFVKRTLLETLLRFPGGQSALSYLLPQASLLAHRNGETVPAAWAYQLALFDGSGLTAIRTTWRGMEGSLLLNLFLHGETTPRAVGKLQRRSHATSSWPTEAALLNRLGPMAQAAGARLPQVLGERQLGSRAAQFTTFVPGKRAVRMVLGHPGKAIRILEQIADWLESWNRATVGWRCVDQSDLERELLAPAKLLAPSIKGGAEYAAWLKNESNRVRGLRVPFVATHGDLTMSNILVDDGPRLGVVDWETSCEAGLPLVDFYHAAVDAAICTMAIRNESEGFSACVDGGGWLQPTFKRLEKRLTEALDVPEKWRLLCFHACWLEHAARNDQFLKIVQSIVARHTLDGREPASPP